MIDVIGYPKRLSEFEIQAELWSRLKALDLDVRGCVQARCKDPAMKRQPKCYFDLVVFSIYRTPVAIIEVKNRMEKCQRRGIGGRQARRYNRFNVPIVVCDRKTEIDASIARVIELFEQWERE